MLVLHQRLSPVCRHVIDLSYLTNYCVVDFDTGSSDTFLPGFLCASTPNCAGHTIYDTRASSTAVNQTQKFNIEFEGKGSIVSGWQFVDTVNIAGLTALGQRIGAASNYPADFAKKTSPPDGLMGMAFQEISEFHAPPVFQTLVTQHPALPSVFGFTLSPSGSELFLGGTDASKYSGTLTTTDVTEVGFWQIKLDGVGVGGENGFSAPMQAIVDTGMTDIAGDIEHVIYFYQQIPGWKDAMDIIGNDGDGLFTVPCNGIPNDISLTIAGRAFSIPASSFNMGPLKASPEDCVGGIVVDNSGEGELRRFHPLNDFTTNDILLRFLAYWYHIPQKCLHLCVLGYIPLLHLMTPIACNRTRAAFDMTPDHEQVGFAMLR